MDLINISYGKAGLGRPLMEKINHNKEYRIVLVLK